MNSPNCTEDCGANCEIRKDVVLASLITLNDSVTEGGMPPVIALLSMAAMLQDLSSGKIISETVACPEGHNTFVFNEGGNVIMSLLHNLIQVKVNGKDPDSGVNEVIRLALGKEEDA